MTRLIVAAGGGGDAVAAAMLDTALYGGDGEPALVLTYAWDRLLVDPVPGPRGPGNFTGLRPLTPHVHTVPAGAAPVAPAGSTLPRLAAELPQTFALTDPHHGAAGIARQLEEIVGHLAPESVDLLDVGGDILARGDEPTLRSPLADALTLAACSRLAVPVRLLIAGPGLDGEIPADGLRGSLGALVHTFTARDTEPVAAVLGWHPSEATAMLAATARGARGSCETTGDGPPVPLTGEGPAAREADLGAALDRNRLARALLTTTGLAEAEWLGREICGVSEIDEQRAEAARLADRPPPRFDAAAALTALDRHEAAARTRGVTHTTFGRLTDVLGLGAVHRDELRALLLAHRPERHSPPLWRVRS